MAKEKNKPVPVRFDLKVLELLKEEEKIDTPQQALNFLAKFWENNRPATTDVPAGHHSPDAKSPAPKPAASRSSDPKPATPSPKTDKREPITHPSGLSGIDLSIWKAEQKDKNRND